MENSRSTRALRSGERAGESFVHSDAFEWLSRAGFVARALVYGIIGVLALKVAFGAGGKLTTRRVRCRPLHTNHSAVSPTPALRSVSAATPLARSPALRSGIGLEGSDSGFDRISALASGTALRGLCALAIGILIGTGGGARRPK
jgi:hypothetical protein